MKIYINHSNENWICDRMRKEFTENNSEHVTDDIAACDIIWLLSHWIWKQTPIELLRSKKVVTTVHHIDPDKFDVHDFLIRDQFVNAYHSPTTKTTNHFPKQHKKQFIIPYWCNKSLWYNIPNKQELKHKYSIPKGKLIIGSFQRDTEGHDLITPKLSKGPDIFCDVVESLDVKPHVILGGWRRQYIISRLEKSGITYSYFEMANFTELNELYNCLDYYLVTSRHEGGPQAVLESSLTETPILSTDVGIAKDVLHENCIVNNPEDFKNLIQLNKYQYKDVNYEAALKLDIKESSKNYLDMFRQVL